MVKTRQTNQKEHIITHGRQETSAT